MVTFKERRKEPRAIFEQPLMGKVFNRCCAFAFGVAAVLLDPSAALSQVAPSQVTPQTLRPHAPPWAGELRVPARVPLQAPPDSQNLRFVGGRVAIKGGFP